MAGRCLPPGLTLERRFVREVRVRCGFVRLSGSCRPLDLCLCSLVRAVGLAPVPVPVPEVGWPASVAAAATAGSASFGGVLLAPTGVGVLRCCVAREGPEVVAGGASALVGTDVVEGADVVEVAGFGGGLAAGEDAGAVASSTEEGECLGGGVAPGRVGARVGEHRQSVGSVGASRSSWSAVWPVTTGTR